MSTFRYVAVQEMRRTEHRSVPGMLVCVDCDAGYRAWLNSPVLLSRTDIECREEITMGPVQCDNCKMPITGEIFREVEI